MAETLDSLAGKIDALTVAITKRFNDVDKRFDDVDKRSDESKSQLQMQIEAVDAKVGLVLEKVDDLIRRDMRHTAAQVRFDERLENHDLRLIALETDRRRQSGE